MSSPESTISLSNIDIIRINGTEVFDYLLNENEYENESYELVENTLLDLGGESDYIFFENTLIREIFDLELSTDETTIYYYV